MPDPPRIDGATLLAYRLTHYHVAAAPVPFILRIDEHCAALERLHRASGVRSSVFVSACNPFGRPAADTDNHAAMQRLAEYLKARGVMGITGEGRGEDPAWPPEPSVLALGLGHRDALELCRLFEQNAVLEIGADAIPRLVLHPEALLDP